MPAVQSKGSSPSVATSSSLTALRACGLILGGIGYAAAWYFANIALWKDQCIVCEDPLLSEWGYPKVYCRGCRRTIMCCAGCWPRYLREVHSLSCPSSRTIKFSHDFFEHQQHIISQPPCQTCGGPASTTCMKCDVHYCTNLRECAMTDWPHHKKECKGGKPIEQLQPRQETKSILESPLPIDLIAHIESFLSFFQWSQCARVNHAWRNGTLLPSGASHSIFSVTASIGYDSHKIGASVRRTLRYFVHKNTLQISVGWTTTVQRDPLPHFPHLEFLSFYDQSHPYQIEARLGEYAASMASTLRRLEISALSFGSLSNLALLTQLRVLTFGVVTVTEELISALDQLTLLKSLFIQPKVIHVEPEAAASEDGIEERRLFSALLRSLSRLSLLTHLRLTTMTGRCHLHDDPLTLFFTGDAPVFEKVTHLMLLCASAHLDQISSLKELGKKFPHLKVFEYNQLADQVCVPDEIVSQWMDSFESILLSALNSVSDTLDSVTLSWPFVNSIRFRSEDAVAKRLKVVTILTGGQLVVQPDPQIFATTFVTQLANLNRLELNLSSQHVNTEYVRQLMPLLIDLPQLEYLALMNLGFPSADAPTPELTPEFEAKRDSHRPLKYLEIMPADQTSGDIYVEGQKLLTWLPRVDVILHIGCELDLCSLLMIAQQQPIMWLPSAPQDQDGLMRMTRLQTLPSSESQFFQKDERQFISHELRTAVVKSDKSAISQILNLLAPDYDLASRMDKDDVSYFNTYSRSRCSHLEFSRVRIFTPSMPSDPNRITQILTDFAGVDKNRLYATRHMIFHEDLKWKEHQFCLLRERIEPLPSSIWQSDWRIDHHK